MQAKTAFITWRATIFYNIKEKTKNRGLPRKGRKGKHRSA
jgi:hypothetical protein